jgi:hypothetical protein
MYVHFFSPDFPFDPRLIQGTGLTLTYEHGKLRFDITAFLMPLVFRDVVFIDDWDQLAGRAVGVPHGGERAVLELRKYSLKLDLLVLRIVTRYGGLSDKMLDDSIFRYCFQQIVLNASLRRTHHSCLTAGRCE